MSRDDENGICDWSKFSCKRTTARSRRCQGALTGGDWNPLHWHWREMLAVAQIAGQLTRTIRHATVAKTRQRRNIHDANADNEWTDARRVLAFRARWFKIVAVEELRPTGSRLSHGNVG